MKTHYIYYYTDEYHQKLNEAKIGQTSDPDSRLKTLSAGTPENPLMILFEVPNYVTDKQIHSYFKDILHIKHLRREWFTCTPEQLKIVIDVLNGKITKIFLKLFKNKIDEKGQTVNSHQIQAMLNAFGHNGNYEDYLGVELELTQENGNISYCKCNSARAYFGVKQNERGYFPKNYELLIITGVNINVREYNKICSPLFV